MCLSTVRASVGRLLTTCRGKSNGVSTAPLFLPPSHSFRWFGPADVKKLVPEGLLDDARAAEVAKAYNAQEGIIVEVGIGVWLIFRYLWQIGLYPKSVVARRAKKNGGSRRTFFL